MYHRTPLYHGKPVVTGEVLKIPQDRKAMNVQGCLAYTQTFRVEILSINKKITRWDDSLPSGRCRPSDKGGGAVIQTLRCGRGGAVSTKKKFPAPRDSIRSKKKGGVRAPQAPPLNPPLHYKVYSNLLNILKTVKRL